MLTESIAIGLLLGFFFYEWVGLTPGGLVVPGYIALYWDRPAMIGTTLLLSLLTFGLVHLLSRITILYGRRRFLLMVITGFALRSLFETFVVNSALFNIEIDTIGYIIPGLIANEMGRQKAIPTVSSLVILSVLVRLVLLLLGRLKAWW